MPTITGTVGAGGTNAAADVQAVQELLNRHAARLGYAPMAEDGRWTPDLDSAIATYQRGTLGIRQGGGLVQPGDRTIRSLESASVATDAAAKAQAARRQARLSGARWFRANAARFPNSAAVSDLAPGFAVHVNDFLAALGSAGAHVSVSSTRRNATRAYLMHYAWKVANGTVKPADVPADPNADIDWDHGSDKASRAAAQEMVALFGIKYQPSLTSNHIKGEAIDMTITWTGPIAVTDAGGKDVEVDKPRNGNDNDVLHTIGASYGVKKLSVDPPHWSSDGH